MGFGVDREPEPEILDGAPEGRGTWLQGWGTRLLRGWGTWLSGRGMPAPSGAASWPGWGWSRLRRVPRWAVAVTAVAVLAAGGAALALGHRRHSTVPGLVQRIVAPGNMNPTSAAAMQAEAACNQSIEAPSVKPDPGYRVEFGEIAVQPAFERTPPYRNPEGPRGWPYAAETAFMFSSVSPEAVISVPPGWRETVSLGTPNGVASKLYLPSCGGFGTVWNTFVTVFYLRSPSICVPLRIQAGRHVTTAWFGLGRPCRN